jgi:hypothetical protein
MIIGELSVESASQSYPLCEGMVASAKRVSNVMMPAMTVVAIDSFYSGMTALRPCGLYLAAPERIGGTSREGASKCNTEAGAGS